MRAKLANQLKQSGVFLDLMIALLGLAALMAALPDYARYMVFPFVLAGWLVSLCLHEFGHAYAAYRCGDFSVVGRGYLTLNPLHYTDMQFSIVWPLVFLALGGIGLPGGAVYLNTWALSSAQRAWVSAAGPLATLAVLIFLLAFMSAAGDALAAKPVLYAALAFLAFLQLTALVLNLLPVPGLDGWGIIEPWLPREWREFGARAAPIAPALLFMSFFLVPGVNRMFWRLVYNLNEVIGLRWDLARHGLSLFRFWS
jgi:Zn-dependent protease